MFSMNTLFALLTHRSLLARALTAWLIGLAFLYGAWAASYAWLPAGSFHLPGEAIAPFSGCNLEFINQSVRFFFWNLVVGIGLTAFASLFRSGGFPLGYLVPWILFLCYGGLLGTNSFLCPDPSGPQPASISILWRAAGVREISAYLLVSAVLAPLYVWKQSSLWSLKIERVRPWKEFQLTRGTVAGLLAAIMLLAWAAVVEAWPLLQGN